MTKKIKLTKGKVALVDDSDYEYLSQWKWYCSSNDYAVRTQHVRLGRNNYTGKRIYMHREILNSPDNMFTDHIDMDKLNNQRVNLRIATASQNAGNMKSKPLSSSKYKGVCLDKSKNKWMATICRNGIHTTLGIFHKEEDAALAYNNAAIEFYGEFARLNEVE